VKPIHIQAKPEDVAERVVVAGDPARVKQLAEYLKDAKLVNENRGFLVYTGYYNGVKVSVAAHGVGGPSSAIVFEELKMLGAKVMIRLGTAGALISELDIGDFVIATGAAYPIGGCSIGMYVPDACMPASPSPDVTTLLIEEASKAGEKFIVGPVFSSDAFYAEDPEFARKWSSRGMVAVEMECATLFTLGWLRKFKTGALLIISDSLVKGEEKYATAKELAPQVEKAQKIVFDAITKVKV